MLTNPMENPRTQEQWSGWGRGEPRRPTSDVGTTAGQRTAGEEEETREQTRRGREEKGEEGGGRSRDRAAQAGRAAREERPSGLWCASNLLRH